MALGLAVLTALAAGVSCQTVDPGPDFVLPAVQYDANYFFCVVEPQILMGGLTINNQTCGGTSSQGCHYSDKVPEMPLQALPKPVACSGGIPVNSGDVAAGTAPALNLASVSLEMSPIYTDAPIFLWPTQTIQAHPAHVYDANNAAIVNILKTWAATQ
jgi:hypothetical protein